MPSLPPFVRLDAHGVGLIFDLRAAAAELVYIGESLPHGEDIAALCDAMQRGRHASQPDRPAPRSLLPYVGEGHLAAPAIVLQRAGHPLSPVMALAEIRQTANRLCLIHRDDALGLLVEIDVAIQPSGIIEVSTRLANLSTEPLGLVAIASLSLPLPGWAAHVVRFAGRWSAEMQQQRAALDQGMIASASYGGRPGFGGGSWIRIESDDAGEQHGDAIAAHLAWSGDHTLNVERNADGDATLTMAARLEPGEIMLAQDEVFTAPCALVAVSSTGVAALRQTFHVHALNAVLPAQAVSLPRKVHLNSWEALAFDQSLPKLKALADNAAALGVERFVLDDGWFAGRRDDSTSLGDWVADAGIFPDGLGPLISHVHTLGMDFGLWVEPEMISPDSDLYRAHPDWCLHLPGHPRATQRGQLVLDLTLSPVTDHLFAQLSGLLTDHAIAYLKWDHNRDLFPLAGKGHAQVIALYALLDRLRAAHPGVEIETCASGGGRVDFEILRRCSRFWASDNNDPIERLRINAGWFDFLPLRIAGNHVGPSPNPITGRQVSMDFRAKVAMFGHMGVEADPGAMSAADRDCLAAHIAVYKQWRDVLHQGQLWQLAPSGSGIHALLAMQQGRGLALIAQTRQADAYDMPRIRFAGLEDDALYRVALFAPWRKQALAALSVRQRYTDGFTLSGRALRMAGISLPLQFPETAWLVSLERCADG
ncbi:MAG: alpha-galactosidase [Erythrobacter sp.]|nr:alpha-galactosidase [Erythrobacter sp.]